MSLNGVIYFILFI